MSDWISVEDKLPRDAKNGVHDAFPVMILLNNPYGKVSDYSIKITTWMNNRFYGFPSGATRVTHWMPLPLPPEDGK